MLISTSFIFIILLSIIGYSCFFKFYITNNKEAVQNSDIIYGFFLIITLSVLLNFFFALKYFSYIIIFLGLFFFCRYKIKKLIELNYLVYFLILFFLCFITYLHGDNVDSPMYHLQIIKWINIEKTIFGSSNLEIRYGVNSSWFNLLSLFKLEYKNYSNLYFLNYLPFTILIYEIFSKKNINLSFSYLYLFTFICFLFFFSFLHPFRNGVILNHLHNTEVDTVGMVFFALTMYFFLKYFEKKKINYFYLVLLSSIICATIKLSYIGCLLFPIFLFLSFKKEIINYLFKVKLLFSILLLFFSWITKGIISSGCLIFPVSKTCFDFSWSPGIAGIEEYSNIVKSFARDTPLRLKYYDFDHTINSYNWVYPWIKEYYLINALLIIATSILLISISLIIINIIFFRFKIKMFNKKVYIYSILILLVNLFIWFQAPEIRFGWATIISLPCIVFLIFFESFFLKKYLNVNRLKLLTLICLGLIFFDNINNLSIKNLYTPYTKSYDYSLITQLGEFDGQIIYVSQNWKCADFEKICVNIPKENYNIKKIDGYIYITK